jgi:hypothetical protein
MKALNLIIDPKHYNITYKYIQLRDGYFYATNGFALLKSPASEVFHKELLAELDSEMYFEGTNWKDAKVVSMSFHKKIGDVFELFDNKMKSLGYLKPITKEAFNDKVGRFPDCDSAMPANSTPNVELTEMAFDPELLDTLYKANGKLKLKLGFYGQNRGMKVTFQDSEAVGLLMPMQLF